MEVSGKMERWQQKLLLCVLFNNLFSQQSFKYVFQKIQLHKTLFDFLRIHFSNSLTKF